jgi:hypothetical protein
MNRSHCAVFTLASLSLVVSCATNRPATLPSASSARVAPTTITTANPQAPDEGLATIVPTSAHVGDVVTLTPASEIQPSGCGLDAIVYRREGGLTPAGYLDRLGGWQPDPGPGGGPQPTFAPCAAPRSSNPVTYKIASALTPGHYVICLERVGPGRTWVARDPSCGPLTVVPQ